MGGNSTSTPQSGLSSLFLNNQSGQTPLSQAYRPVQSAPTLHQPTATVPQQGASSWPPASAYSPQQAAAATVSRIQARTPPVVQAPAPTVPQFIPWTNKNGIEVMRPNPAYKGS